jgi:rubrerythrin
VERILAIRATPRTALDRLAEREQGHLRSLMNDLPTRLRDTSEYQHLLDEQTSKGTPDGEDAAKDDTTIDAEETEDEPPDVAEQDP